MGNKTLLESNYNKISGVFENFRNFCGKLKSKKNLNKLFSKNLKTFWKILRNFRNILRISMRNEPEKAY
jgi:hypothetical protein